MGVYRSCCSANMSGGTLEIVDQMVSLDFRWCSRLSFIICGPQITPISIGLACQKPRIDRRSP